MTARDAERLASVREPGNEKLLAREREHLTEQRRSLKEQRTTAEQALTNNALSLLRCDGDTAGIADGIEALWARRLKAGDEPVEAAVWTDDLFDAFDYLCKRLHGSVVE